MSNMVEKEEQKKKSSDQLFKYVLTGTLIYAQEVCSAGLRRDAPS